MSNANTQQGNVDYSPGSTGAGGAISSFGGSSTVTNNANDNSNAAVQTGPNYGAVLNAGEGSNLVFNGSDYGAIAAATSIAGQSLGLANSVTRDSQITARLLGLQAQDTVAAQGAGALSLITKPFIWLAVIVAAAFVIVAFASKRKQAHAS